MKKSSELEEKIGIVFKNKDLLKEALTHSSYWNEHQDLQYVHNERLEYLGDAVLELVVTEYLFNHFPDSQEDYLSDLRAALVNYKMMATVANEISVGKFMFLAKGVARAFNKTRELILANAMEAIIGAIYLDQGYESSKKIILTFIIPHLTEVIEKKLYRDPKTLLQELLHGRNKATPTYQVIKEEGPDHQKTFTVSVSDGDVELARGTGMSKQEAEMTAAHGAMLKLEKTK